MELMSYTWLIPAVNRLTGVFKKDISNIVRWILSASNDVSIHIILKYFKKSTEDLPNFHLPNYTWQIISINVVNGLNARVPWCLNWLDISLTNS